MHLGISSFQRTICLGTDDFSDRMHRIFPGLSSCRIRNGFTYQSMRHTASERFRTDIVVFLACRLWFLMFSQQQYHLLDSISTDLRNPNNRNALDTFLERYKNFVVYLNCSSAYSIAGMRFALARGRITAAPRSGAFTHAA